MTTSSAKSKQVLVTGDFTIDWNIAHLRRAELESHTWNPDDWTRACRQRGGAALLGDIIEEVVSQMESKVKDLHFWQNDALYKETGDFGARIKRKLRI